MSQKSLLVMADPYCQVTTQHVSGPQCLHISKAEKIVPGSPRESRKGQRWSFSPVVLNDGGSQHPPNYPYTFFLHHIWPPPYPRDILVESASPNKELNPCWDFFLNGTYNFSRYHPYALLFSRKF